MRIQLIIWCFLAVLTANWLGAVDGTVTYSDGTTVKGDIAHSRSGKLKFGEAKKLRDVEFSQVKRITMLVDKEDLVQKWWFPEAGKTTKVKRGKPYPMRYLKAKIEMLDGQVLVGHLYTTMLWLRNDKGKQKVILPSKQRGKEGETLEQLVYPQVVDLSGQKELVKKTLVITWKYDEVPEGKAVLSAITRPGLNILKVKSRKGKNAGTVEVVESDSIFAAAQVDQTLYACWKDEGDEKLLALVQEYMKEVKDFFDRRKLISVQLDKKSNNVFSLVLMSREGKTSLHAEKSQPWRLVVLRWKYDPREQKLLLGNVGHLCRGIIPRNGTLPEVKLTPDAFTIEVDKQGK